MEGSKHPAVLFNYNRYQLEILYSLALKYINKLHTIIHEAGLNIDEKNIYINMDVY